MSTCNLVYLPLLTVLLQDMNRIKRRAKNSTRPKQRFPFQFWCRADTATPLFPLFITNTTTYLHSLITPVQFHLLCLHPTPTHIPKPDHVRPPKTSNILLPQRPPRRSHPSPLLFLFIPRRLASFHFHHHFPTNHTLPCAPLPPRQPRMVPKQHSRVLRPAHSGTIPCPPQMPPQHQFPTVH